jgi:CDGSH-type Zn-finger protein
MSDDTTPMISVRENASIRAANIPNLKNTDGQDMELKPVMGLCRCGQSANKPYCDGSHKRADFDGSSTDNAAHQKVFSYIGTEIDVHYSKLLCSHAAECGRLAGAIFDTSQKPWIQPDKGTVAQIKEVVHACPSGALRYSVKGEKPRHLVADNAGISVQKDGPYWVQNIPLEGDGNGPDGTEKKYVLCRCGQSNNKPYCDGSHSENGWSDES